MRLRIQLLLLSVSILVLPWSGCQFVKQMEISQRQAQLELVKAKAEIIRQQLLNDESSLAALLRRMPTNVTKAHQALPFLMVTELSQNLLLDGELDDWQGIWEAGQKEFTQAQLDLKLASASQAEFLWLGVSLADVSSSGLQSMLGNLRLHINLFNGERLSYEFFVPALRLNALAQMPGGRADARLLTSSSELELLLDEAGAESDWLQAYWQTKGRQYQLEIRFQPLSLQALQLADVQFEFVPAHSETAILTSPVLTLKTSEPLLAGRLSLLVPDGVRLSLLDVDFYPLAEAGTLPEKSLSDQGIWLWFYRQFLGVEYFRPLPEKRLLENSSELLDQAGSLAAWYDHRGQSVARVVLPVGFNQQRLAYLILEQSAQVYLSLTQDAFGSLLLATLLSSLLIALGLLLYASYLSYRIRLLNQAAHKAVDEDGAVNLMPGRLGVENRDELGDLARAYQALLMRVKGYNDYLQGLGSKLSHELKTPLAIIKTSLDNLEQAAADEPKEQYLKRAQSGAQRLSAILSSLGSASRIENMIQHSELECMDIVPLLQQLVAAYRDTFASQAFIFESDLEQCELDVNPDLLVQLLDKLIDNAVDFSVVNQPVIVALQASASDAKRYILSVSNSGPLLPESLNQQQIFDSLVSVREQGVKEAGGFSHLGLGLYIVKLIAEFHQAGLRAYNRSDGSGVVFELAFKQVPN